MKCEIWSEGMRYFLFHCWCLSQTNWPNYIFFFGQDEQPKKNRAVYKCWRNKWGRSQRNYYLWGRSQHNYYLHSYKCVYIHNLNFYYLWKVLTGIWLSIDNLDHLIIGNQLAPLLSLSIFRLLFFLSSLIGHSESMETRMLWLVWMGLSWCSLLSFFWNGIFRALIKLHHASCLYIQGMY